MKREKRNNTVENVLQIIKAESRAFKEVGRHALFGVNVGDILDDIINRYYKDTLPAIATLKDEDKKLLQTKLLELSKKHNEEYDVRMFSGAANYINNILHREEEKEIIKEEIDDNPEIKGFAYKKIYSNKTKPDTIA